MGKGKKEESSSCCSPHNISGGGGGLRRREAYELRSRAARTRSGLIRVPNASPPSKIPNQNQGDSRRQVPPRPEQMEKQNKESESSSNPPAPPSPVPMLFPHSQQRDNLVFPKQNICRSVFPEVVFPEPANLDEYLSFRRGMRRVLNHLSHGGTDVERIKREVGVTDETLRKHGFPANLEEYRESRRRLASPHIKACFAKLNETTNQDDDLELLDVLFLLSERPYGKVFYHMHFRATRKSKADQSPGLYCAVFFPDDGHVIGCVFLQNDCDCPGDSQGRNSGKCLDFPGNSANTIEETYEHARGGIFDPYRGYALARKIAKLSPHNNSARKIPVESSWKMFQIGYNGFIQPAEGELDRERVGMRKGKEVFSFSRVPAPGDSQGRNSGKCLHFAGNSANTIEEALEYASGGCHKALHEYVLDDKYCYEIGKHSPHNDSAREIPGESFLELYQKGYSGLTQRAEGELDRERVGTRKRKEVFSFS